MSLLPPASAGNSQNEYLSRIDNFYSFGRSAISTTKIFLPLTDISDRKEKFDYVNNITFLKKGFRFSFAGGVMLFLLLELPKLSLSSANVLSKPFWSISTPAKRYKHVNHMSVIISFNNVNKCINNRIMLFVSRHRLCSAEKKPLFRIILLQIIWQLEATQL